MISKLCDYGPRSDFIVKVICDLVKEHPRNQIMVLGHNRCLLVYLHDTLKERNVATIGYYLGGMKQKHLNETETKQIVIGSYSMCSEGFDLPTLSTLVMVTPKTDIVQSVGRILRQKHGNPIIVDIVDTHSLFQNQFEKRKTYYRKCNYDIRKIDSRSYTNMTTTGWKQIYTPKITGCATNDDEAPKCLIDKRMFDYDLTDEF